MFDNRFGHKKAPSTDAVENGAVANVEDKHSFHNDILYVKLVSAHSGYLLELPEVNLPMGTYCPLEKAKEIISC